METLECGGSSGSLKDSPNQSDGQSSTDQVSHVETRGVLFGASGKPLRRVLQTSPMRIDAWKPKQVLRSGPRGLSGTIDSLWGYPSACGSAASIPACVRSPLFVQGSLANWDGLGDIVGSSKSVGLWPMKWAEFLWRGQAQSCAWLQGSPPGGCVGQNSGDRSLKTQPGHGFGA